MFSHRFRLWEPVALLPPSSYLTSFRYFWGTQTGGTGNRTTDFLFSGWPARSLDPQPSYFCIYTDVFTRKTVLCVFQLLNWKVFCLSPGGSNPALICISPLVDLHLDSCINCSRLVEHFLLEKNTLKLKRFLKGNRGRCFHTARKEQHAHTHTQRVHLNTHLTSYESNLNTHTHTHTHTHTLKHLYPGSSWLHSSRRGVHFLLHEISQLPLLQLQAPRTQFLKTPERLEFNITAEEQDLSLGSRFWGRKTASSSSSSSQQQCDPFWFSAPEHEPLRWPGRSPEQPSVGCCRLQPGCHAASSVPAEPEPRRHTPSHSETGLRHRHMMC